MRPVLALRLAALVAFGSFAFAQKPVPAALTQVTAQVQAAVGAGEAASRATHEALAARQQMLLDVYRNNPAQARANALPLATRQALLAADPTTATLLEYEIAKTGELTEAVADNWTDGSSTMRYGLHTPSADLDLSLPANVLATVPANHHLVTVHGMALADVVAAESLTEASPAEATACAEPAKSYASNGPAPLTCSPLGVQRVAVLIVKFPAATPAFPTGLDQAAYWNQVLFGANPSVNAYWNEVSQGQTSATGDVFGPFQLSAQYDCTTTSAMQTAAIAAAAGTVDFSLYNRIVIVYPVSSCTFGGLGNIGCVGASATIAHQYSVVWLPISSNYRADFSYPQMWGGTSHELGHNLGLNHANTLDFNAISLGPLDFSTTNPGTVVGNGSGSGAGSNVPAVNTEYGDNFDVMGYPWNSGGPYNAVHRTKILGWIPQTDERDITAGGTFTLVPAENASGLRALHVLRDAASTSWLWVEFHQPVGYYESANFTAHTSNGDTETTGAQIHYDTPFTSGANPYTYLLDMTPVASTTTGNNNFYDGTLAPGKSWSDPYSLLTISVGTQTSAGLNVTVSYDAPCATLALSASTIPAAGGAGTLTITAPSSCNWTVSSNATWITFPGAVTGSGSAVVGFTAAANTGTLQRNTYISAQRQSLALVQPGSYITVQSLTPNMGSSAAGAAAAFTLTFSDAAGLNDVNQLNFDWTGLGTPDCQVSSVWNNGNPYLYLFSNGAFSSGIQVGSASTLTSPSCSISAAASAFTTNGTTGTLTVGMTFPTAFLGEHNVTASAYGKVSNTASLPVGVWTVTSGTTQTASTTTLAASPAASASFGQAVTFTASVAPASATGMVTFTDGTTVLGIVAVSNGSASVTTSALAVGTHSVVAAYAGDASNGASSSGALSYVVTTKQATATTTALTVTPSSVPYGTGFALSAAVTPAGATGSITFQDASNGGAAVTSSPGTLSAGKATATSLALAVGSHTLTANYAGDGTYAGSASVGTAVTVTQAGSTTKLTAAPQPVSYGNALTLSAVITSPGGTGSVSFMEGTTLLGKVTVVAGVSTTGTAALTLSTLAAGTHTVTAVYSGDANVAGSSSASVEVVVGQAATTIVLTPSSPSLTVGSLLTLSSVVTPVNATGTVTFFEGTSTLGSGTLVNGIVTTSLATLPVGSHVLTAYYSGDSNDAAATSAAVTVTVTALPSTTTTLTGSASSILPSGAVVLTARVVAGAGGSPTGNVSFMDGGSVLGTAALNAGAASYTASGLAVGTHTFTAVYAGSTNAFLGSTSGVFPVVVAKVSTNFAVGGSAATVFAGGSVTLTAAPNASAGTQTAGTMTFTDGATTLGTVTFATGATASFTATNLAAGTHTFGAVYSGSTDLTGATGATFAVAVQDFAITLPTGAATVTAGGGQSFPLTLTPGAAGFGTAVALSCTGAPSEATCSVAPGSVTPGGAAATATLSLTTTARPAPAAGWLLIALAPGLLALRRRNRARMAGLLTACAALAVMALVSGCGQGNFNGKDPGTPAGTYTLTISGTATGATTLTHTTTFALTVK